MELLDKRRILSADDKKYDEVDMPEWGGKVRIRTLSGKGRAEFERVIGYLTKDPKAPKDAEKEQAARQFRELLIVQSCVDAEGKLLFTEADIPAISELSAAAITRLVDKISALSAITQKEMKEMEKNSAPTATEDSPSA